MYFLYQAPRKQNKIQGGDNFFFIKSEQSEHELC